MLRGCVECGDRVCQKAMIDFDVSVCLRVCYSVIMGRVTSCVIGCVNACVT